MNKTIIWKMGWLNWLCVGIAVVLLFGAFWSGLGELIVRWDNQEEYSHGYMLPMIALYFIWLKKNEIILSEFNASWLGVIIVLLALAVFIMGEVSALFILIHYSFIAVLIGSAIALMGWPAVKPVLLPLFFLIFAVPLPYFLEAILSANLQLLSSQLGVAFIRWCNIPVFLEGNVIDLGAFQLQVVEACSGLRYLFPLMSLGFICAYMFKGALWKKIVVFLSTIPITLLMNSFRIGVIGILVDNWGIAMAEGFLHDFEGWFVFMACMGILIIEIYFLNKIAEDNPQPLSEVLGLAYSDELPEGDSRERKLSYPLVSIISLLVISFIIVGSLDTREETIPERKMFSKFPDNLGEWTGSSSVMDKKVIDALLFSDYILSDYVKPGSMPVNFYVAYYESQRKGVSPHSPRVCIPGGGWQISDIKRLEINELKVNRIVIKKDKSTQLVYYWFQQRGRAIANEYFMKWYLFKDALFLNRTDGALVRITTPVEPSENIADADARLVKFSKLLKPVLSEYIPE